MFIANLLLFACLISFPEEGPVSDSLSRPEAFAPQELIAPGALVSAGAVIAISPCLHRNIDIPVRDWAAGAREDSFLEIENYIQYAPYAGYVVAGLMGAGDRGWAEHLLAAGTSAVFLTALTRGIKYTVCRPRPEGGTHSFPSGHTATAFVGAELIRLEYGPWWGLGAYSLAVSTAALRVWHGRHWTSDVLAGAGIGILCADMAYWLLPWERKITMMPWSDGRSAGGIISFRF